MKFLKVFALAFALNITASCGTTRVVVIDSASDMVRLGNDCRGHVFFYKDGEWVRSKNVMKLPEGWFAGAIGRE